jgi:hypothetical protein
MYGLYLFLLRRKCLQYEQGQANRLEQILSKSGIVESRLTHLDMRHVTDYLGDDCGQNLFPKDMWFNSLVQSTRRHDYLKGVMSMLKTSMRDYGWIRTSPPLSGFDSTSCLMALNASQTRCSVNGAPISHLSSNDMKILNGRDSE